MTAAPAGMAKNYRSDWRMQFEPVARMRFYTLRMRPNRSGRSQAQALQTESGTERGQTMKLSTSKMWVVGLAMAAAAGMAQAAGRGIDRPMPHAGADIADSGAVTIGNAYAGRRVDQQHVLRERLDGAAEFAVMDLHGQAEEARGVAYQGRRTDSLHRMQ